MEVITNCPVALAEWNIFDQEAVPYPAPDRMAARIWKQFAAQDFPWRLDLDYDGSPGGLAIILDKSGQSQFDKVVELAGLGYELPEFLACVALEGNNFHGQAQRPWKAERGNLHLTVFIKTGIGAPGNQEAISILPTLALMDAFNVEPSPEDHTGIRWLNDLFIDGRKVGGAIAESQIEGNTIESIVYGIGLNVESDPAVPPNPFVRLTGSLQSTLLEGEWTLGKAFVRLIAAIHRRMKELTDGFAPQLQSLYVKKSACVGEEVRIWHRKVRDTDKEAPFAQGRVVEILPDLSVRIEGNPTLIRDGRLAFESDCRALGI
ncbi:MAG: hypothetical protein O2960_26180 [Verrucomicrobia bacterium]|nr:hypothetical protein [Verrucomicrobiota bacterium]